MTAMGHFAIGSVLASDTNDLRSVDRRGAGMWRRRSGLGSRAITVASARSERRPEQNDRDKSEHGADDPDHDDVEVALPVRRPFSRSRAIGLSAAVVRAMHIR